MSDIREQLIAAGVLRPGPPGFDREVTEFLNLHNQPTFEIGAITRRLDRQFTEAFEVPGGSEFGPARKRSRKRNRGSRASV